MILSKRFLPPCVFASVMMTAPLLSPLAWAESGVRGPVQTTKPIYPWRTDAEKKADGKDFSHCQVKDMYDNGILLALAENTTHQRRLVLNFPQDKLVAKEGYDLQWQVDRQPPQSVTAIATGPRMLAIALDDTMTRQMARGNLLFLRGPNDTLGFDMRGVQDAVRSLQDCLVSNNVKPAPIVFGKTTAAPVQADPAPAPAPAATKTPVAKPVDKTATVTPPAPPPVATSRPTVTSAKTEIPADLAQKLSAIGLAPKNVMQVPDDKRAEQPFDVVWNQSGLLLGLKSKPPVPHQAMTQIAATFSKQLQTVCNGEFLAEGGDVEKRGDVYVMPAEIACSPRNLNGQQEPNSVAAMLLVMDARALRIVFIEAPEKLGSQAVNLRDALQKQYR